MKAALSIGKLAKRSITTLAKFLGVEWYQLVDARVRLVLFLGLKGERKKVYIVGLNKTGTSSLGEAMRGLGRRHLSYSPLAIKAFKNGDVATLRAILAGFDSFDDKPWNDPSLWPLMKEKNPESLWIYTFRDVNKWSRSYLNYSEHNDAQNEVAFINSLDAEQYVSQHHEAAKDFEKSNEMSFVWLDCDDLSSIGSAKLSTVMGREVKIGHHNMSRSNEG